MKNFINDNIQYPTSVKIATRHEYNRGNDGFLLIEGLELKIHSEKKITMTERSGYIYIDIDIDNMLIEAIEGMSGLRYILDRTNARRMVNDVLFDLTTYSLLEKDLNYFIFYKIDEEEEE